MSCSHSQASSKLLVESEHVLHQSRPPGRSTSLTGYYVRAQSAASRDLHYLSTRIKCCWREESITLAASQQHEGRMVRDRLGAPDAPRPKNLHQMTTIEGSPTDLALRQRPSAYFNAPIPLGFRGRTVRVEREKRDATLSSSGPAIIDRIICKKKLSRGV